ncbi:hypothetical protein HMPREF3191_01255 [Veillonellaceae bacterium DNF00626]|nr:hypothetical protein HMPREF3191_01255 [Veillonellaceae bacterium DNF00626]
MNTCIPSLSISLIPHLTHRHFIYFFENTFFEIYIIIKKKIFFRGEIL